jgi:hypothetical protein
MSQNAEPGPTPRDGNEHAVEHNGNEETEVTVAPGVVPGVDEDEGEVFGENYEHIRKGTPKQVSSTL